MNGDLPRAWGEPAGAAVIRACPEDFQVTEQLGFEPSGDGEHAFLFLEKRGLTTADLVARVAELSGLPRRAIGFSGMKDRNAVTRQWLSVGLAGRAEPDWAALQEPGDIRVLDVARHRRKLKRGVHRGNRFRLRLRELDGDRHGMASRLARLRADGAPNYFGEQRFGRDGDTLRQARRWMERGGKVSAARRSLYVSALRSAIFNGALAARVADGSWNTVRDGDTCLLSGSRSLFRCDVADTSIARRAQASDLHPGLPLWGVSKDQTVPAAPPGWDTECVFLERLQVAQSWRATRLLPDDFCWQFCDDDSLQLDFDLGAGSYATALLAEFVRYTDGSRGRGTGSEQG